MNLWLLFYCRSRRTFERNMMNFVYFCRMNKVMEAIMRKSSDAIRFLSLPKGNKVPSILLTICVALYVRSHIHLMLLFQWSAWGLSLLLSGTAKHYFHQVTCRSLLIDLRVRWNPLRCLIVALVYVILAIGRKNHCLRFLHKCSFVHGLHKSFNWLFRASVVMHFLW